LDLGVETRDKAHGRDSMRLVSAMVHPMAAVQPV
jgi:hypothetical protein